MPTGLFAPGMNLLQLPSDGHSTGLFPFLDKGFALTNAFTGHMVTVNTGGSRIALVGRESSLVEAVQTHLRLHLDQPVSCTPFDRIAEHLARDADGLIFVLASETA